MGMDKIAGPRGRTTLAISDGSGITDNVWWCYRVLIGTDRRPKPADRIYIAPATSGRECIIFDASGSPTIIGRLGGLDGLTLTGDGQRLAKLDWVRASLAHIQSAAINRDQHTQRFHIF